MNALLIAPPTPDTFWSFRYALRFIRKQAAFPPLGLLTVAGMLPKEWRLRLVDTNVQPLKEADLAWADTAWIGGMSLQADASLEIIERCRAAGVKTVVGGPMATCEPQRFAAADHLVLNEAEVTLPSFLEDLERGAPRHCYEDATKPDLALSPTPRWDLVDRRQYGSMCLQFSRGCPYDCDFCTVTALLGKAPRTKRPEQVISELDALYRSGWRGSIFFVDDNLIGNRRAVRELLPAIRDWRRGKGRLPLFTEASINLADDEDTTRAMVDAGFDTVFVGIETPDEASLEDCGKRHNARRDMAADIRKLHRAGLQVQGGFILGFDGDTPSIFHRQVEFIQQSGIVTAMVGLLQAPIGTRLYESLRAAGRLRGDSTGDNVDGTTNVVTKMPLQILESGYRRVMDQLYAPQPYYQRVRTFLRDYRPAKVKRRFELGQMAAFLRSAWRLGIVDQGRRYFWRLLAWTTLRRPRSLPLAVRLWIYGYHFREVCRQRLLTGKASA